MNIEIVTIGTELLLGFTVDTNAAELGRAFADLGVRVTRHVSVADDPAQMRAAIGEALDRTGLVITSGGLGPTRDDISREVVADLLGMPLQFDDTVWATLQDRYRRLGRDLPDSNRTQAMVPAGATVLRNLWGTAPALWLDHARGTVIMLPGVPFEMRLLLQHEVLPRLQARMGDDTGRVIRSRTLRTSGVAESLLAEKIGTLDEALAPLSLAYLPQTASVDLRLTAWLLPAADADERLRDGLAKLRAIVDAWCYGEEDADLAGAVLDALRARGLTVALAESCTGGMMAARLTAIPGSSASFLGAAVCYADAVKEELLDVPAETLREHGAVSAETAAAMARGAAKRFGADIGVSITGVAGPGGGTEEKPVGTVWFGFAVSGREDQQRAAFPGTRAEVRERAVMTALTGLLRRLGTQ